MDGHEGVPRLEIDGETHGRLVELLDRIRGEHRARMAFLAEASGRPVAVSPGKEGLDEDGFASLAASVASAAGRLASAVHDGDVSVLIQKGEQDLIQLTPAGDLVLVVVFDAQPSQGLERLRARLRQRRSLGEIRRALAGRGRTSSGPPLAGVQDGEIDDLLAPMAGPGPDPAP